MDDTLRTLLFDTIPPNRLKEVAYVQSYISDGCPHGEPLFLSLGETWEHTPKSLTQRLSNTPAYTHGYQLSMYGLPELRKALNDYLPSDHRLPTSATPDQDFRIATSWTGTRNAMYDYGRLLQEQYFKTGSTRIITTAPGWDYPGVFGVLGYATSYVELSKAAKFQPSVEAFEQAIHDLKDQKALLIINAQHNPTSVNWPEDVVRSVIKLALKHQLALLIDDAHYGVHDPQTVPTSALRILLEELTQYPGYQAPWLGVRSLGKQFSINGWGIGCLLGKPQTVDDLVNAYRPQHIYNYGGMLQYALAQWLPTSEPVTFVTRRNAEIQRSKQLLATALIERFGYQETDVFMGTCTNFVLFSLPQAYQQQPAAVDSFLKACLAYGIVLTNAWPRPYDAPTSDSDFNCVRVYAGASEKAIAALIERLAEHGFHYHMTSFH